jgi:histone RNA hairpin-binding protein
MTPARAKARLKQIAFGYNTVGYSRYIFLVPKDSRGRDMGHYPRTPDPYQNCSKRSFDGQIKKWRRLLHAYDPREDFEELRKGRLRQKTVRAGSPTFPTRVVALKLIDSSSTAL